VGCSATCSASCFVGPRFFRPSQRKAADLKNKSRYLAANGQVARDGFDDAEEHESTLTIIVEKIENVIHVGSGLGHRNVFPTAKSTGMLSV
jgi:hypothetical protein